MATNQSLKFRAQSAVEYLMTYGWAILIVAVIIVALYNLGLFASSSGPRANTGSCQVVRPNGPFTNQNVYLGGLCNGEEPEFVGQLISAKNYFDIAENVQIPGNQMTVTAWAMRNAWGDACVPAEAVIVAKAAGYPSAGEFAIGANMAGLHGPDFLVWNGISSSLYGPAVIGGTNSMNLNTWYFLTGVYNGVDASVWLNGQLSNSVAETGNIMVITNSPPSQETNIGAGTGLGPGCHFWQGAISNVQLYDIALSANEIQQLYIEGIGGAPINLNGLYGWWPLNGNGNDYSGDGLNGGPLNISYTATWSNGYTPP